MGFALQPRTVRVRLAELDRAGLTRLVNRRRGRILTNEGMEELRRGNVIAKLGFVTSRIDSLSFGLSFDSTTGKGALIANLATMPRSYLARALEDMRPVFLSKLGMGNQMAVLKPGDTWGGTRVGAQDVGLLTVCSVSLNGILLKKGIPVTSRYGGLLEFHEGRPRRFVELLEYQGTTLDPLALFIRSGMTGVRACARTGEGCVGASFREAPEEARPDIARICRALDRMGLGGPVAIGQAGEPLCGVPVRAGHVGIVVLGGLNPIAALCETGARVTFAPMAGLADASVFRAFNDVRNRFPTL